MIKIRINRMPIKIVCIELYKNYFLKTNINTSTYNASLNKQKLKKF